jgi:hypothetical protein
MKRSTNTPCSEPLVIELVARIIVWLEKRRAKR